jgi:hypothetical protein
MLKIRHHEFANGPVNGFAKTEAGVIGLGDCAPMTVDAVNGQDVVVVANCFEVDEHGLSPIYGKGGCGEQGTFHAMSDAVSQDTARRSAGYAVLFLVITDLAIEEALNPDRML